MPYTLHVCQNGNFCLVENLHAISDYLAAPDTMVWLDLERPDAQEMALLSDEFGFHPLAIEDAIQQHERPKIDTYESYYLLVFYAALYDAAEGDLELEPLSLFIGGNYLVSIRQNPIPELDETIKRWKSPKSPLGFHVSGILHALLDTIVDNYFSLMDGVVDKAEDLEDRIFTRFQTGTIEEIFQLKKALLMLRRVVAPERDVLNVLLRQQVPIFKPGELIYAQDVYDHLVRVTDSIDTYRDLLSSALDSYLSLQSNQLNQLVKALTLTSIILMGCSLIAGIYGMNFAVMPELQWVYGYPLALGLMVIIAIGLAIFFRSRKWW